MPISFYEITWIFLIYAFLGWCTEVAYAALCTGKFVNRGFLNGPVCPVYGCGMLLVIVILTPLKEHFLILFIGSLLLTTGIEFVTGFLLEKIFHNQWWDYSKEPFNICGYVCLKFSILWGLACTFIMDIIHPTIYSIIKLVPKIPGIVLLAIFCIVFGIDIIITVSSILKFNKNLKLLDEIADKLKVVSNGIGENIYEGVAMAIEKSDDFKETVELKTVEFSENHEELVENLAAVKNTLAEKKENITEGIENIRFSIGEKKEDIAEGIENIRFSIGEKKEDITEGIENIRFSIGEKKEEFAEGIGNIKLSIGDKKEDLAEARKDSMEERKEERKRLQIRYKELLEGRGYGEKRLLKAFPGMKSKKHQDTLSKLKHQVEQRKK
ncbi:MAG: hypothetical protein RSF88_04780 [Lachnospiraceae bacterium]